MRSYIIPTLIVIVAFATYFFMRTSSVSGQLDKMYRFLKNKGYDTHALNSLNSINIEAIQYFGGFPSFHAITAIRLFIYNHQSLILFPPLKHEAEGLEELGIKKFMELPLGAITHLEVLKADDAVAQNRLPAHCTQEIMVGHNHAFIMIITYNPAFLEESPLSQTQDSLPTSAEQNLSPESSSQKELLLRIGLSEKSLALIQEEIQKDLSK